MSIRRSKKVCRPQYRERMIRRASRSPPPIAAQSAVGGRAARASAPCESAGPLRPHALRTRAAPLGKPAFSYAAHGAAFFGRLASLLQAPVRARPRCVPPLLSAGAQGVQNGRTVKFCLIAAALAALPDAAIMAKLCILYNCGTVLRPRGRSGLVPVGFGRAPACSRRALRLCPFGAVVCCSVVIRLLVGRRLRRNLSDTIIPRAKTLVKRFFRAGAREYSRPPVPSRATV